MTTPRDAHSYAFLTTLGPDGRMAPMDDHRTRWKVAVARPAEGSTTERDLADEQVFEDVERAAKAFFGLMREGLPGVLDTPDLRAFHDTPLAFTEALTEAVCEDIDEIPEEDARDDDFDNSQFSPLREAMVDACPEFSGEDPDVGPAP